MTIRNVGSTSTYPTIADAVAAAAAGDTIRLQAGYSDERAVLTVQDLTVMGGASSLNIDLVLGLGINNVTLAGLSAIDVWDNKGSNTVTGNGANNTVHVSGGADVVLGGVGNDHLVLHYGGAVTSVIGTVSGVTDGGTRSVTFDAVEDFTILTGGGNDTLTTGDGDNLVRSAGGNDTITTGQGDSRILSGDGNDTVQVGDGHNLVNTGLGDDSVTTGDGGNTVNAGEGDNTVTTGTGDDIVSSGGGNDTLNTAGGSDHVLVAGGIDTADTGTGHDLLKVDYSHLATNVTGSLSAGSVATGYSGLVADTAGNSVSFSGVEHFQVTTGSGDDAVRTGGGDDTLSGGNGNDMLQASAGRDVLVGGDGNDTLSGGRGADALTGGLGADCYRFDDLDSVLGSSDRIIGLQAGDSIDLSRIDADVNAAGNQAFVMRGNFTGAAGEATLKYFAGGDVTRLSLDTDGDSAADIVIIAAGDHRDFASFVL
jgi:Ca2+-binding RTX toxin-like protein